MNAPKWTPGPWRADWDDNGQWYIEPLGITGHALRGDSGDCIESASAHLIAAAPDLYEALEQLDVYWCREGKYEGPDQPRAIAFFAPETIAIWRKLRSALARARGEA